MFTTPFPIILTFSSLTFTSTILIPESCISSAISAVILFPFSTKTSPVSESTISSNATLPVILVDKLNFLLNLFHLLI